MYNRKGYILLLISIITLLQYCSALCGVNSPYPKVCKLAQQELAPLAGNPGRDTLKVDCSVAGNPFPTLKWFFNDKEITLANKHYNLQKENSLLLVYDSTVNDTGRYKCVATNIYGSVFGVINVEIHSVGKFAEGYRSFDTPKEVDVVLGRPLTLQCPKHTEGLGQIYFWGYLPKTSQPLIWGSGNPIKQAFVGGHGEFMFSYVTQDDVNRVNNLGGTSCILYQEQKSVQSVKYKLKVKESVNETAPAKLLVYMKPKMREVDRKGFTMTCGAIGKPHPKMNWFFNGKALTNDDGLLPEFASRNFSLGGNAMVLSVGVTKEKEGTYKCVAENDFNVVSKSGFLKVESYPVWKTPLKDKTVVYYQDTLTLSCEAYAVPKATYEWYHNNSKIDPTDERINGSVFKIGKSDFFHSGMYMCVASNYLSTIVAPGFVDVQAIAPRFNQELDQPTYLFKHHANTIVCNVTAGPAAVKTWFRNDTKIEKMDRYSTIIYGSLVIKNAKKADGGQFKCVAENVKDTAQSEATVYVVEKTVITIKPAQRIYKENFPFVQLFCDAKYETEMLTVAFDWLKDGKPLQYSSHIYREKRVSGLSRILYLKGLQLTNAGSYTCHIYTSDKKKVISSDQAAGSITIIANPKPPTKLVINGDCKSGNASLSWTPTNHFNVPIKYYIVEYASATESPKRWYKYNATAKHIQPEVTFTKKLLPPLANLIFRIKAVSLYKDEEMISEASELTDAGVCVTLADPPVVNPSNVKSIIGGNGMLTIAWDKLNKVHQPGPNFEIIVAYRKFGDVNFTRNDVSGDVDMFKIENPGSKEKYEVYVQSKNDLGSGPKPKTMVLYSGEIPITVAVGQVMVTSKTSTLIQLSWDEVKSASRYRIYYEARGSRRRRELTPSLYKDIVSQSTGNLTGLSGNTNYRITVAAVNINGPGPESAPLNVRTAVGVPNVPTDVGLKVLGKAIQVTWSNPRNDKDRITGYTVTWYKSDEKNPKKYNITLDEGAREAFITENLNQMAYYTVELTANNAAGTGMKWLMEGVVVSIPDVPGKPANPDISLKNSSVLNVTFLLPPNYFGGMPSSFKVYYLKDGDDALNTVTAEQTYPDKAWVLLESLETKRYYISTSGVNSQGEGVKSEQVLAAPKSIVVIPLERAAATPFYEEIWFLILIIVLVLLIILVILIYCICNKRGGGKYQVGAREKDRGGWDSEVLKDYADMPMDDINGVPVKTNEEEKPIKSVSQTSVNKVPFSNEADADSLDDYAEDTKFNEDGSFIGQYGEENKINEPTQV